MTELYALSGTPGVGKSTVARILRQARTFPAISLLEVSELPGAHPITPRRPRGGAHPQVEVDLAQASRAVRRWAHEDSPAPGLLVGHLAHLLPIPRVVLLRCAPDELARRLRRQGAGEPRRSQNVEAERVDVVLLEALRLGRTIYELDTTGRSPSEVARWVRSVLRGQVRPRHGVVDWLARFPPTPEGPVRDRRGPGRRRSGFKGGRPRVPG